MAKGHVALSLEILCTFNHDIYLIICKHMIFCTKPLSHPSEIKKKEHDLFLSVSLSLILIKNRMGEMSNNTLATEREDGSKRVSQPHHYAQLHLAPLGNRTAKKLRRLAIALLAPAIYVLLSLDSFRRS